MSQTRYFEIEKGLNRPPTDEQRKAIAAAFGVTVADIAWPELLNAQQARTA